MTGVEFSIRRLSESLTSSILVLTAISKANPKSQYLNLQNSLYKHSLIPTISTFRDLDL